MRRVLVLGTTLDRRANGNRGLHVSLTCPVAKQTAAAMIDHVREGA